MLNYQDAMKVFKKFDNYKAVHMCQNNIGCLHFQEGKYFKAVNYFKEATSTMEGEQQEEAGDQHLERLVQMSRTFMQGFALYHLIKKSYDMKTLLAPVNCDICH